MELTVSFVGAVVDGHTANERLEVLKDELQVKKNSVNAGCWGTLERYAFWVQHCHFACPTTR